MTLPMVVSIVARKAELLSLQTVFQMIAARLATTASALIIRTPVVFHPLFHLSTAFWAVRGPETSSSSYRTSSYTPTINQNGHLTSPRPQICRMLLST
jgi:hypothetical protein